MLLRIVAIVFPVFAIVAVGWLYARLTALRGRQLDMGFANRLNMDVFVPALVFAALATKDFDLAAHLRLAWAALFLLLGSGLCGWILSRCLRESPLTLAPPMMFINAGNMGLPLLVLAFGEAALPAAVVLFFVENTLHYTLGTWLLDRHARLWTLWRVPVIAAAMLALAINLAGLEPWPPLFAAIKLLGDVAVPLLLFSLGVRLASARFSDVRLALFVAAARPLAGMALAAMLVGIFGLTGKEADMLIVFGALPPAVLNYVFAERYGQEPQKVASLVMVGNLAALVFVPIALAWVFA
ncbi:MAG: AEC family transporter [Rhodocyclaceae bacterium]|nr:AEC family transporter [Rhodocyclaceae bacterium]